jgi:hypothetical protein
MSDEMEDQDQEAPAPEKETRVRVSLKRKRVHVDVENEDGDVVTYTIVELVGKERDTYLNFVEQRVGVLNGQRKVRDYRGMITELLGRTVEDENGQLVKKSVIDSWPSSMQSQLADISRDISRLDDEEEDDDDEGNL